MNKYAVMEELSRGCVKALRLAYALEGDNISVHLSCRENSRGDYFTDVTIHDAETSEIINTFDMTIKKEDY